MWDRLKRLWDKITDNIVTLLFTAGIGVSVLIWGIVKQAPQYLWPFILLGAIALVLLIVALIYYIKDKNKKDITKLADKELETLIRDWIDISAFSCKRLDDDKAFFRFYSIGLFNHSVEIYRDKEKSDFIHIATNIPLTPDKSIVPEIIAGKISVEMARLGVQFQFENNKIIIGNPIFIDTYLNRYVFNQGILLVIRARVLAQAVVKSYQYEKKQKK